MPVRISGSLDKNVGLNSGREAEGSAVTRKVWVSRSTKLLTMNLLLFRFAAGGIFVTCANNHYPSDLSNDSTKT